MAVVGYRIKDTRTGLYSVGGIGLNLRWNKQGKVWVGMGALRNHLQQMPFVPANWQVVEVDMSDGVAVDVPLKSLRRYPPLEDTIASYRKTYLANREMAQREAARWNARNPDKPTAWTEFWDGKHALKYRAWLEQFDPEWLARQDEAQAELAVAPSEKDVDG